MENVAQQKYQAKTKEFVKLFSKKTLKRRRGIWDIERKFFEENQIWK